MQARAAIFMGLGATKVAWQFVRSIPQLSFGFDISPSPLSRVACAPRTSMGRPGISEYRNFRGLRRHKGLGNFLRGDRPPRRRSPIDRNGQESDARVGRLRVKVSLVGHGIEKVTVHESMVTNVQRCMESRRYLPGASADVTNGTRLGANHYMDLTCEQRLFLLLGLHSRSLHLKPSVFHMINNL